ncbi:permease [Thermodesulfatator indicus DSM 15286]|uniref:Permease n=1 Tax=Thermodesulfatator indicus (strain DSM 15286 / JCM 11887 / CIR29812) TaxID=667014 RepID=F8AA16_THEID|nr:permease [Thermodesulfatator indicus]AEH45302.1 permease [Thermodesulfatator indicus DSM 15286]
MMNNWLTLYLKNLFFITADIAPYFLFGLLIAGFIKILLPKEKLSKHLGARNFGSIFKAAALGVPLPLCSCSVIPVAILLARHGAGLPAVVAFLVATPQTSIDALFITFGLFGVSFALVYALAALAAGIIAGTISFFLLKEPAVSLEKGFKNACCPSEKTTKTPLAVLRFAFIELMLDLNRPLLLGLLLAALLVTLLPPGFLGQKIPPGPIQYLFMLVAGIPLYMCSTGSLPLAYSFYLQGFSPGSLLVFLMSGPATNTTSLVIIRKLFGGKTFLVYALSLVGISLLAGILLDFSLTKFTFRPPQTEKEELSWFKVIAAVFLIGLMVFHFIKDRSPS